MKLSILPQLLILFLLFFLFLHDFVVSSLVIQYRERKIPSEFSKNVQGKNRR